MEHVKTVIRDYERSLGSVTCSCGKWCWTFTILCNKAEYNAVDHLENEHRKHVVEATKLEILEESMRNFRPQLQYEPLTTPTLRDQFAMAALNGMLSNSGISFPASKIELARISYEWADSMLEARK